MGATAVPTSVFLGFSQKSREIRPLMAAGGS
jgi:hypothetical protein